ncbi:kinase-like domain-containing protein [Entophlyctis helioformis]|nr:kinase-like domain-containing protein [Entophlyctis helioformis]
MDSSTTSTDTTTTTSTTTTTASTLHRYLPCTAHLSSSSSSSSSPLPASSSSVQTAFSSIALCHDLLSPSAALVAVKRGRVPAMAAHELHVLRALAAARVANVPAVLDVLPDPDSPCQDCPAIVMPHLLPLVSKHCDLITLASYIRQLATILRNVHAAGWIHMDISPANVMLDHSGNIVLIDWGLARVPSSFPPSPGASACGTPGYVAPEAFGGPCLTSAADIYALGVLAGQWLELYIPGCSLNYLGSKLVRHPTTTFICRKIDERRLAVADGSAPSWPPIIDAAANLLFNMLQADPDARISAAKMLEHPFLTAPDASFDGHTYDSASQLLLKRSLLGNASLSSLSSPNRLGIEGKSGPSSYTIYYRGR